MHPTISTARLFNRGIDTLYLNVLYVLDGQTVPKRHEDPLADSDHAKAWGRLDALCDRLDTWKLAAQEAGEPVPTEWSFEGESFHIYPNGANRGQFPWLLKCDQLTLCLSRGKWNGVGQVRLSSRFLWSCRSLVEALGKVERFLYLTVFQERLFFQVSEVHLCADVGGWDDFETLDRRHNFVSRSRKRDTYREPDWGYDHHVKEYSYGLHETGLDFSQRGPMSCTIYDKTREVKQSGKEWFPDLWALRGYDLAEGGPVWRVECKFKREALHELKQGNEFHGVEDAYELPDLLPVMWAYAVGHVTGGPDGAPDGWIRCVIPDGTKKRSRWPAHPAWKVVQSAFTEHMDVPPHFGKIIRKRHEQRSVEKAIEAIMGYATSCASWVGGNLAEPETDFSVFLNWLAVNGEEHFEKQGRTFATEVQRKRVKTFRQEAG